MNLKNISLLCEISYNINWQLMKKTSNLKKMSNRFEAQKFVFVIY